MSMFTRSETYLNLSNCYGSNYNIGTRFKVPRECYFRALIQAYRSRYCSLKTKLKYFMHKVKVNILKHVLLPYVHLYVFGQMKMTRFSIWSEKGLIVSFEFEIIPFVETIVATKEILFVYCYNDSLVWGLARRDIVTMSSILLASFLFLRRPRGCLLLNLKGQDFLAKRLD